MHSSTFGIHPGYLAGEMPTLPFGEIAALVRTFGVSLIAESVEWEST